jgi:antitoxin MazE
MITKVTKWGNSLALRIPKHYAEEVGLTADSEVEISLQKGAILVEPVEQQVYSLETLLSQINDSNLHREIDTGHSVGNEVW